MVRHKVYTLKIALQFTIGAVIIIKMAMIKIDKELEAQNTLGVTIIIPQQGKTIYL